MFDLNPGGWVRVSIRVEVRIRVRVKIRVEAGTNVWHGPAYCHVSGHPSSPFFIDPPQFPDPVPLSFLPAFELSILLHPFFYLVLVVVILTNRSLILSFFL